MSRNPDRHRCTHKRRERDGTEVECSDAGGWTLDKAARTWRPSRPADKSRRCWAHGPGAEIHPIGPRPRRAKPNARLQRQAGLLLGIAPEVTRALADAQDELSLLGYPSSSGGANYTASDCDPVGGDVARIMHLTAWREDMRDAIADMGNRVDALIRLVRVVRDIRWAHGVKLCAENQQGHVGSIEWGDPTCTELPVKGGLCPACYQRERRWRADHDMPSSEAPAA